MRRERTERARQVGTAAFDDLDAIVAQVFATLDTEDVADGEERAAPRRTLDQRNVLRRRTSTLLDGRDPEEVAEGDIPPASFDSEESAAQPFSDRPGAPADAELRTEGLRSSTGSLAIATDEEDFVRQAAAWLASRSNAEGVLDRVRVAISEHKASPKPPPGATAGDPPGGSERGG
jgi:rhodanese-related sulfurtransferase